MEHFDPPPRAQHEEEVVRRVEDLLADMGWTPMDLAKRIYKAAGYKTAKAVEHRFMRKTSRRLSSHMVLLTAHTLGVSSSYILGDHDNLEGTMDPDGLYALRRQVRRLGG